MSILKNTDPEIARAILDETERQSGKLEMIASENFVSEAVLEAQGSIMTNKYAEGYPAKRYYGGCEYVDVAETLAIERCKQLFGADHVNVQPHSGTQANMAVYFSVLEPGDTILGMNLSHGGHLSHGSPANFSGKLYNVVAYGVDKETETIDFNEVEEQARKHKPKLIVVGASAYSRTIDFGKFRWIADQVGAVVMADIAHIAKLPVNRGETDIGHAVEPLQFLHDFLPHHGRGNLPALMFPAGLLDIVHHGFDGVHADGAFFTGLFDAGDDLHPVERFPPSVLLHHHGQNVFDIFIGGETLFAGEALPPAPDGAAVLADPGINDPVFAVGAERTFHRCSTSIPASTDMSFAI
jgi:hypothetical protein